MLQTYFLRITQSLHSNIWPLFLGLLCLKKVGIRALFGIHQKFLQFLLLQKSVELAHELVEAIRRGYEFVRKARESA
jgi:hypothetical protein